VVMFKLMLLPLPCCFLLILMFRERHRRGFFLNCMLWILMFTIGLAIVLLPLIYAYQSQDQLNLLYDTFITDPIRITRELPHTPVSVLKAGIIWFVKCMGLLFPLAAVGAYGRRRNGLTCGMIVWLLGGIVLIILQHKGWDYHYLLLLCPLAILATEGIELLIDQRRGLVIIPILLLAPYLLAGLAKAVTQIHDQRPGFYSNANAIASVLNTPGATSGPVYILGTPLVYYLSDRSEAIAINGWSPELLLDNQWKEVAIELRVKRPAYIYVDSDDQSTLDQRGQAVAEVLKQNYTRFQSSAAGTWYQLRRSNRRDTR
jgi:hypothetical protein